MKDSMNSCTKTDCKIHDKDRILIRFNTKFEECPAKLKWRVLVNGQEFLADKVYIEVPCESITEPISTGEIKHHILCHGKAVWEDSYTVRVVNLINSHKESNEESLVMPKEDAP
jgi:hypothetical protein